MNNILTLDLGTCVGWALSKDGQITSGTNEFKPGRYEGGGMRYLRFQHWLKEMKQMADGEITAIYFEEVRRHAATDAAHVYGGFMSHLASWCETNQIPYQGVPVSTIKRHATGKGNADKQAMIDAMTKRGHAPKDDNEADALAILYWATEEIDWE